MESVNQTPMVISRGGYAALLRVLLDQDDLLITKIESEPVEVGVPSPNRYYRQRLTAEGEQGIAQMTVILKVLPEATWLEAWNPRLDGPAEIVALESDLLSSLPPGIIDPTLANARARDGRPAWTMSMDLVTDLGQGSLPGGLSEAMLRLVLFRLAELHALHWDALTVLDYVYPWLTRQSELVQGAATLYTSVLGGRIPDSSTGRWLFETQPSSVAILQSWLNQHTEEDRAALRRLLNDPQWVIEVLAATPTTICHGAPLADHLGVIEDRLALIEWERMQVGPSSWDVWTFWSSLNQPALTEGEALDFYLESLERIVGPVDRDAWLDSYALAPVVGFLVQDLPALTQYAPDAELPVAFLNRAKYVASLVRAAGR